jgi:hypothetical protein
MPHYSVDVVDIGLRFEEGLELGLETEQFTRKQDIPSGLELNDVELRDFKGRQRGEKSWVSERIELNAFAPPDVIAFIERKLQEAGAETKVVPPKEVIQKEAWEEGRSAVERIVRGEMERIMKLDAVIDELASSLFAAGELSVVDPEKVKAVLTENRDKAWDHVVGNKMDAIAARQREMITQRVREAIAERTNNEKEGATHGTRTQQDSDYRQSRTRPRDSLHPRRRGDYDVLGRSQPQPQRA